MSQPKERLMNSVFDFRGSIQIVEPVDPIPKDLSQVRDRRGWKNPNCKLSRPELLEICRRFDLVGPRHQPGDHMKWRDPVSKAGRETWERIAADYRISRRHVWAIGTGRLWGHVTGRSPRAPAHLPEAA